RFIASFAERCSLLFVRKNPLVCFRIFLRRARRLVPRLTLGIEKAPRKNCETDRRAAGNRKFTGIKQVKRQRSRHAKRQRDATGLSRRDCLLPCAQKFQG